MNKNIGVIAFMISAIIVIIDGIINVGDNCWGDCQIGHSFFALTVLAIGYAIMFVCAEERKRKC